MRFLFLTNRMKKFSLYKTIDKITVISRVSIRVVRTKRNIAKDVGDNLSWSDFHEIFTTVRSGRRCSPSAKFRISRKQEIHLTNSGNHYARKLISVTPDFSLWRVGDVKLSQFLYSTFNRLRGTSLYPSRIIEFFYQH